VTTTPALITILWCVRLRIVARAELFNTAFFVDALCDLSSPDSCVLFVDTMDYDHSNALKRYASAIRVEQFFVLASSP
jgi:hypothetical protein